MGTLWLLHYSRSDTEKMGLGDPDSRVKKDLGFGSWLEGAMLRAPYRSHGQGYLNGTTAGRCQVGSKYSIQ